VGVTLKKTKVISLTKIYFYIPLTRYCNSWIHYTDCWMVK